MTAADTPTQILDDIGRYLDAAERAGVDREEAAELVALGVTVGLMSLDDIQPGIVDIGLTVEINGREVEGNATYAFDPRRREWVPCRQDGWLSEHLARLVELLPASEGEIRDECILELGYYATPEELAEELAG